jgi:hypothetical protein
MVKSGDGGKQGLHLLLNGDIVADAAVLASDADTLGVVRSFGAGLEGSTALRVGIIVIVLGTG